MDNCIVGFFAATLRCPVTGSRRSLFIWRFLWKDGSF